MPNFLRDIMSLAVYIVPHAERDSRDSKECSLIKVEHLFRMWLDFGMVMLEFVMWLDDFQPKMHRNASLLYNFSTSHIISISMTVTALKRVQELH